jgi:hypothetical protein
MEGNIKGLTCIAENVSLFLIPLDCLKYFVLEYGVLII